LAPAENGGRFLSTGENIERRGYTSPSHKWGIIDPRFPRNQIGSFGNRGEMPEECARVRSEQTSLFKTRSGEKRVERHRGIRIFAR
jgi:hypothetical protein